MSTLVGAGHHRDVAVIVPVDDPADERVSDYVGLRDPELRRLREGSNGTAGGFFVAEGVLAIRQLLASPYRVRSFLLSPSRLGALEAELEAVDAPVYVAAQPVLDAIAAFHLHRGALAVGDRRPLPELGTLAGAAELLVVAEGLNDHENLGALFRNAAAFGAAVVLSPSCADPLYRRSVRVSVGQVLRVPFTVAPRWPAAVAELRALGFEVLALTPSTDAQDLRSVRRRRRQALLVGAEGPGLSAQAVAGADRRVRIAMAPGVDSLNVATAAAVALHHLARPA